jgi:hypothetical protein
MKAVLIACLVGVLSATSTVGYSAAAEVQAPNDKDGASIVSLGAEMRKHPHIVEAVCWPAFDFHDVKAYVAEPNKTMRAEFVTTVRQVLDANSLPDNFTDRVVFLKGWRGAGSENCVIQYEKGPYLIRVRNQKTVVHAGRDWESYWITIAIERKDGESCLSISDPNNVMAFSDRFLCRKVSSKSANFKGIQGMDKPVFERMDGGYLVAYPVQASGPDVDGVIIWSNGRVTVLNLQERRKEVIRD